MSIHLSVINHDNLFNLFLLWTKMHINYFNKYCLRRVQYKFKHVFLYCMARWASLLAVNRKLRLGMSKLQLLLLLFNTVGMFLCFTLWNLNSNKKKTKFSFAKHVFLSLFLLWNTFWPSSIDQVTTFGVPTHRWGTTALKRHRWRSFLACLQYGT